MGLWIKARGGKTLSDDELIAKYRKTGDIAYLGQFYSGYMELVYGVCLKYLGSRADSQDAVMDIFEKLVTELTIREVANYRAWLFVVTKNHCLMHIRAGKVDVRNTKSIEDFPQGIMENATDLHPIDDNQMSNDEALLNCIERLKNEQKECVNMFYYENLCYRDIAEKLRIDEKQVKSYLQNAKRNLKICLEATDVRK